MAIDPSKIAKAIRAAQAAKKKVAKVPRGEAREVAREARKMFLLSVKDTFHRYILLSFQRV
jgi:hypothetical protein